MTMTIKRPFGYGRFSNDELQDQKSITDQQHIYTKLAERIAPGHGSIFHFADEGISGADPMITRAGLQSLLRAAAAGECDGFLFIESTDRLSRDPADLHTLYKLLTFHRVRIFSVEEGEVTDMVIGLKAAMNGQFLKALGQKTLRGLIGEFNRGKWPSRAPYGYRFDRSKYVHDKKTGQMMPQRGVLEIDPVTAAIVVLIFEWYDAGLSGEAIAKRLNKRGIPSPSCPPDCPPEERRKWQWGPTTINGNWRRGTGILNNTVYIGQAVYNRQRFEKDPTHVPAPGKKPRRRATLKDVSELEHVAVPHLRIINDDDLWQRVKDRQQAGRVRLKVFNNHAVRNRRPIFLFSGLTKCEQCGAGFNLYSRSELRCYAKTKMGATACTNPRTITRQEVESRVLHALKERFLADPVAFEDFCAGFREAQNQHRMEQRERITATKREFDRVTRDIQKVIDAIIAGYAGPDLKAKNNALQERKTELLAEMASLEEPEPLLHPSMGDLYRTKVEQLAAALETGDEIERERAKDAVRALVEKIVIPADKGQPLMVFGDLGKMLQTAANGGDGAALAAVAYVGCGGGI